MRMGYKYSLIAVGTIGLFSRLIACGSQMYQVSLHQDTEEKVADTSANAAPPKFGIHSPDGWKTLPVHFSWGDGLSKDQMAAILASMSIWEKVVGKQLFSLDGVNKGVTGDTFSDLYSSLNDPINGHYLDKNWTKTAKPKTVLATTIWNNDGEDQAAIATADIRYNLQYYVLGDAFKERTDGAREVVDMESLALHELGHLLGLTHVTEKDDPYSIMNPSLFIGEGLTSRHLSEGDVQRIRDIYGCEGDVCKRDIRELLDEVETVAHSSGALQAGVAH